MTMYYKSTVLWKKITPHKNTNNCKVKINLSFKFKKMRSKMQNLLSKNNQAISCSQKWNVMLIVIWTTLQESCKTRLKGNLGPNAKSTPSLPRMRNSTLSELKPLSKNSPKCHATLPSGTEKHNTSALNNPNKQTLKNPASTNVRAGSDNSVGFLAGIKSEFVICSMYPPRPI